MDTFFGIDLGTSNCAIASAGEDGAPDILPLTQVVTPNGIGEKSLLPSAIYIPAEGEFPEGGPSLPWNKEAQKWFAGIFARDRGALQPDRLIVSAKSWLCHPHADRRGPILPWGSATVDHKISPLEASRDLLAHLLASLKYSHPNLASSHPVITVPASFDEVARGLPTALVLAAITDDALLKDVQAVVSGPTLRAYTSTDLIGVEIGGTLKNVYALGAGLCDGLGLGSNAKAAMLTRSLQEMARLGEALGARPETFLGLGGVGDLMATAHGSWSRNRSLGEQLAKDPQGTLAALAARKEDVEAGSIYTTRATLTAKRERARAKGEPRAERTPEELDTCFDLLAS